MNRSAIHSFSITRGSVTCSTTATTTERPALESLCKKLDLEGYCVVSGFLTAKQVDDTKEAMYDLQETRIERNGELGVLRLMMDEAPFFLYLLEHPRMLEIIDSTVGNTAILHTQNGFILPSLNDTPNVFQNSWHMDFRRVLNGYLASINVMVCLDDFTEDSGATQVMPESHQREMPGVFKPITVECKAGDAFVFDSTLWHRAGINKSGKDRCSINHQFTKSWIKQQLDYPRVLDWLEPNLSERTKQLLGFYSRVPASLEQYYHVPRYYRAGQG